MRCRTLLILILLTAPLLQACSSNPATGRRQLSLLSRDQEIALGTEAMPQLITEYGGRHSSNAMQEYVTEIGAAMARHTEAENPTLPWEFTLLDSDIINAFALPGGKVFISRGLMSRFTDEAQLAAVLGHEIGHVTAKHGDERISSAMVLQGISDVAGAIAGQSSSGYAEVIPLIISGTGQGYLLKFSRDQESEADALGVRYMTRAGYDPTGMLDLIQILIDASGGSSQPEILSTHPNPERRHRDVQRLIEKEYADLVNNPQYQRHQNRFRQRAQPILGAAAESGSGERVRLGVLPPAHEWCGVCNGAAQE